MNDVLFKCLGETFIVGVTGNMYFGNGDDPDKTQQIERIQSNKERSLLCTTCAVLRVN